MDIHSLLEKKDKFSKNATFQNIMDIYNFDHEFRHILLKYIQIIEVTFKSIFVYEFTKIHGPTGHFNKTLFTNQAKHQEILTKSEKQKNSRLPHEVYLKHYIFELKQDIPFWAYVDLLTIADISFLYSITKSTEEYSIKNSDGTVDNAHLYGFIFIMKRLLSSQNFITMKNEIKALTKKYPFVCMSYYGFRDDWDTAM